MFFLQYVTFSFFYYLFYIFRSKGMKIFFGTFIFLNILFVLTSILSGMTNSHTFGLCLKYFAFIRGVRTIIAMVKTIIFPFLSRLIIICCLLQRITVRTLLSFGLLALFMCSIVEWLSDFKTFTEIHELVQHTRSSIESMQNHLFLPWIGDSKLCMF